MPAFSQGSTVSFAGVAIGSLQSWEVTPGQATTTDATNQDSPILGAGNNARVVKELDCTSVDPGTASITLLGTNANFVTEKLGMLGDLTISFDGGGITLEAIFAQFTVTASVGELIKGTATFQFTGKV